MKRKKSDSLLQALGSGLAGALALTLLHETARRLRPENAPRMDVLGMRALRKLLHQAEAPQPNDDTLFNLTMAGDVLSNGLYYSLVGSGKKAWQRGAVLGLAAGVGGVVLPGPLGLGEAPSARTPQTKLMTVAWYLVGGLVAAGTSRAWRRARKG
ncbi:hypothetical protein [Hymenobacter persicinus]|uniref:DUF1440 domain-containing protein n=1 Tax=Hymenobacter persicinus TaxID=2025506 RepID=A0A4Q5LFI2_9BACT|nr:hypothetical protein [Hymenobacter persicinus]RYU83713.1 hypothetical protein EWM57_01850 [Hymenobacter persicinus]